MPHTPSTPSIQSIPSIPSISPPPLHCSLLTAHCSLPTSIISTLILLTLSTYTFAAEQIRIATWNVEAKFTPAIVQQSAAHFQAAAEFLKPDILLLQEVSSLDVVNAIRDAMGLTGFHTACSEYNQDHSREYASLETAVISRFPLTHVVEFDPVPDNVPAENDHAEQGIYPQPKLGIAWTATYRGFLWARIDAIKLTAVTVHFKSSRGDGGLADADNARQREFVAAAIADSVLDDVHYYPGYSFIVAGDFNVGHSDAGKNGLNLFEDCYSNCEGQDLYDETHAILGAGIFGGLQMKNLTLPVTEPTYPGFPGTPIDNIYAAGAALDRFSDCQLSTDTFGSDHRPVWTVLTVDEINLDAPAWHGKNHHLGAAQPTATSSSSASGSASSRAAADPIDPNTLATARPIALEELQDHIGQLVTITGPVLNTNNIGNITFINFGARGSGLPVVVVFRENYSKWSTPPETLYRDKTIAVTGEGATYRGTPQIILTGPEQVKILD